MKLINTKYRSKESEIMDSFELQGEGLVKTLKDLERINRLLGGNKITLQGIEKLGVSRNNITRIADIGCGNGAMLREIAKWGRKNKLKLELIGIDANPYTVEIAVEQSRDFPEISFKTQNIFSDEFKENLYDIFLCSLTLHHFKNPEIKKLLRVLMKQAKRGIVINDLQRSKRAYYLFRLFCVFFVKNNIAKTDGLISILRGFKQQELNELGQELALKNQHIKWCWAFRYRWIIPAQAGICNKNF